MIPKRLRTVICLLVLTSVAPVQSKDAAITRRSEMYRKLSTAQELQKKGDFEKAASLLRRDLEAQTATTQTPMARLQLEFTLGYLYEQEAARRPQDERALLSKSEECYRTILAERPDHEATTRNLASVYRRLGQEDKATDLLAQAVTRGADKTGALSMQLGDLYAQEKAWTQALSSYTAAAERSGSEVARRRVIQVYQQLPPDRMGRLLDALPSWELQSPGVAKAGYEAIIKTAGQGSDAMRDRSLLLWLDLLARKDASSLVRVRDLPTDWRLASEVRAWLDSLQDTSGQQHRFALYGSDRRHVFARLALAVGAEHLRANRPQAAVAAWQSGVGVAPDLQDYRDLRRVYPSFEYVKPDLVKELAFFYYQSPYRNRGPNRDEIDRLARLIQGLFTDKGGAYAAGDLEAIHRLHVTLGLIYDKMGVWGSASDPENAHFQLSRALESASRIEQASGFYQPLPELSRMLAEGQRKHNLPAEAATSYLRAAQEYLDLDQLDTAGEMLQNVRSLDTVMDRRQAGLIRQVEVVLGIRRSLIRQSSLGTPVEGEQTSVAAGRRERLLQDLAGLGSSPFLARQRFKIFSDLALAAEADERSARLAAGYARRAYQEGLDRLKTLVGAADLDRLERLIAFGRGEAQGPAGVDVRRTQPSSFDGRVWRLFLPGEYRPMFVLVQSADVARISGQR